MPPETSFLKKALAAIQTQDYEILEGLRAYDDGFDRGDSSITAAAMEEIARGMKRADAVFREWGLVPEDARAPMVAMEREGIRSPRLTGAGGGGFLVGLVTGGETKRPGPGSGRS